MITWNWRKWIRAALIRAVKTFAQTMAGSIAVGVAISEVDWVRALSVAGAACVLSLFTSLAGLPEVERTDPPDALPEEDPDSDSVG